MPAERHSDIPLPSGTVTFLFTDIEGSTRLWENETEAMRDALARHDALVRESVERAAGHVFKTVGDAACAVFADAPDALAAALDAQRRLASEAWPTSIPLKVRMAIHSGAAEGRDRDYFGPPLNRVARLLAAAHGGQTILSQATFALCRSAPPSASLRDLGLHRLKDLAQPERVYELRHPDFPHEFPAIRSLSTHPNNLPQEITTFVGRRREQAAIDDLLARTRLVTLAGVGGSGKTRLALQVAGDALHRFPDGAWLVELGALTESTRVVQAIADVLGQKERGGETPEATLVAYLADKRMLVVLDNCEHLLVACALLADTIVRQCPSVTVLATSREPLGIAGEQTFSVPPLSLPRHGATDSARSIVAFESAQLFVDRARLARNEFELTEECVPALASLCRRLDGIPLAIELAAARVRLLSLPEIERRLDQRFRLLTGGSRAAMPRHQTLRALIDWSYELLDASERALLQTLSVFVGGWTLEAAEAVHGGDVLELHASLCDKNLVVAERGDGPSRYRLLETVSEYARERLLDAGRTSAVRERHRDHYLSVAESTAPKLVGAEQAEWLQRLDLERDNLRAALEWSMADPVPVKGLRLCGALQRFWWTRGHLREGREWCTRFLDMTDADDATAETARAANAAGVIAQHQADYDAAWALQQRALAIRTALGDREAMASSLNNLGTVRYLQCDLASAREYYGRSIALSREIGDDRGLAGSLYNLGIVARDEGNLAEARALIEEQHEIAERIGDRSYVANSLLFLATIAVDQDDLTAARRFHAANLAIRREQGDRRSIAYSFEGLASLAAKAGEPLQAARAWGIAARLRDEIGAPLPPSDRAGYDALVREGLAAAADDAAFHEAWRQGLAMGLDEAIAYAQDTVIGGT
jgi:predicted ATPase/class 3 adenylate cyclase